MAGVVQAIVKSSHSLVTSIAGSLTRRICRPALSASNRCYATDPYDPYPEFDAPSPYKKKEKYRHGYVTKLYTGGVLPRPEGELANKPLPIPMWRTHKTDNWIQRKALFGQNDYIDILGDGTVHPFQLVRGPLWLRSFKGNELQRLIRRRQYQGSFLREYFPTKYHDLTKRIFFLYKRLNKRRRTPYWGSRFASSRSRIDRIRK